MKSKFLANIASDFRSKRNLDVYITAIIAFVTSILGVFGAPISIVSSATLAILTLISIWLLQNRQETEELKISLSKMNEVKDEINSISSAIGLKVSFIQLRKGEYKQAALQIMKLVSGASREILALDFNPIVDDINDRGLDEREMLERQRYYQEYINKVVRNKPNSFKYRRIIQIPSDRNIKDAVVSDKVFFAHCEEMIKIGNKFPEYVSLKSSGVLYYGTFIIIDRKFLILEIDIFEPDDGRRYDYGMFILEDHDEKIISNFYRFFERADAKASLVRLQDIC